MEETNMTAVVIVDDQFALLVPEEKIVLVHEVLKHFQQRWAGEANEVSVNGEEPHGYIRKAVATMLKRLSIPFAEAGDIRSVRIYGMLPEDPRNNA